MTTKKKLVKFTIMIILIVFLLITGLSAIVPYMGGNKNQANTGDVLTGEESTETVQETVLTTGAEETAPATPELTKEQKAQLIQLSGAAE